MPEQSLPNPDPPIESPNQFIQRALAAGLDNEEIQSEVKARYNVDLGPVLSTVSSLKGAVGSVFREGAPEGMREKTIPEEIMEPISTTAGIVGGALKGASEIFGPDVVESVVGTKLPLTPFRKSATKKMVAASKDIDRVFKERSGEDIWTNIRSDLTENVEGILEIMAVIRGAEDYTEAHRGTAEHLYKKLSEGADVGEQFTYGAAADLLSLSNPKDYFHSRPITSLMMAAPAISQAKKLAKLGYIPAQKYILTPAAHNLEGLVEKAKKGLEKTETGVKVKKFAEGKARQIDAGYDKFLRVVSDPFVQQTEGAKRLVEALMDTAEKTKSSVTSIASRWAETQKKGRADITPVSSLEKEGAGIRLPVEKTIKALMDQKKIPWEKLNQRQKARVLEDLELAIKGEDVDFSWMDPIRKELAEEQVLGPWESYKTVKLATQNVEYNPTTGHFGISEQISNKMADAHKDFRAGFIDREQYNNIIKSYRKLETRPTDVHIFSTQWKKATVDFARDMSKLKHVDAKQTLVMLNQALADTTIGRLRSPNLRKLVVDRIVEKVKNEKIYTPEQLVNLKEKLGNYLTEINKRDPESPSYQANADIRFDSLDEAGMYKHLNINIVEETLMAVAENPKLANRIFSEVINDVGIDMAAEGRINTIKAALTEHMPMFGTEMEWIAEALKRGVDNLPPLIQGNPHHLATRILNASDRLAHQLADSNKAIDFVRAEMQLKEIAHKIRSYKRMPDEIADTFGIKDHIKTRKGDKDLVSDPETAQRTSVPELEYEVFAPEGVIDTLKFEHNARRALIEAEGFWFKVNRYIKGNLTARNLASAMNNIKANFVYQTFRRADPLLTKDLTLMLNDYHGFRTGKDLVSKKQYKLTPEKKAFFEAMERTGLLDTTALDIELPTFTEGATRIGKAVHRGLEKIYKGGDNIFKLEDAWYNYKKLKADLTELQPGEWMDMEVKPGQKARLERVIHEGQDRWKVNGELIPDKYSIDDFIAHASSVPGSRIFFDYSNVPNLVKYIRASRALGVVSPFFTWFWKAIDIPGVKRGLISELMTDGINYSTNNKTLQKRHVATAAKQTLKRTVVINGLRNAVIEENNDETLRKVLSYSPRQMNVQLLEVLTNPTWIGHDSEESANQFAPSDIVIRSARKLFSTPAGDEETTLELYPKEIGRFGERIDMDLSTVEDPEIRKEILLRRKLLKRAHTGEGVVAEDLGALVGVSGNPLMDGLIMMTESSKAGKKISKPKITQMVGTALMGGTPAALLDIAAANLFGPSETGKLLSTRRWAENPIDEPQERMLKWAMRRIMGIGYRPLNIGSRSEWYFKNKEREWKLSLTGNLEQLLKDNPGLEKQDRLNIEKRIFELHKIIEAEMGLEKLRFQEVYEKLQVKGKGK